MVTANSFPTIQETTLHMNITRWSILKSDCGSDGELHTAKCRLKSKEVEKTTRPFRYDLNRIPHDYTVMVKNRVKGLDLADRA